MVSIGIALGEGTPWAGLNYYAPEDFPLPRALRMYRQELQAACTNGLAVPQPALAAVWVTEPAFPDAQMLTRLENSGILPLLYFQTCTYNQPTHANSEYVRGIHDGWLVRFGAEAALWGGKFILRIDQEMNGTWAPWSVGFYDNTPDNFIMMWRRVVDKIREGMGAKRGNMKAHWCPSARPWKTVAEIWDWYPGDNYVDALGFDAYESGGKYREMSKLYEPTYDALCMKISRMPIIVGETGIDRVEFSDVQCGKWLRRGLLDFSLDSYWERLVAITYFNLDMTRSEGNDWTLRNEAQRSLANFMSSRMTPLDLWA